MRHWLLTYDLGTRLALYAPLVMLVFVLWLFLTHLTDPPSRKWTWKALLGIAVGMFLVQPYFALSWSPPEKYMGDVYRILYMHVPQLIMAMLALTINFGCSVAYLFKKSWATDSLAEATAEVGLYLGAVGITLGSLWAKPTWNTWWTWDPRLISAAVMMVIYAGYLTLRRFVEDPEKRATWSAVMGIIAGVDIPVLYFSVKWWRSIHQVQSNPSTVDDRMVVVLRWSYVAFAALTIVLIYQRFLAAQATRNREVALPEALPPDEGLPKAAGQGALP